jgi:hypothetical protein
MDGSVKGTDQNIRISGCKQNGIASDMDIERRIGISGGAVDRIYVLSRLI